MVINTETIKRVTIARIIGDIDGKTAPEAEQQILSLVKSESRILLDLSQVDYMSSAGLRMLLSTYRQISNNNGHVALVGLSEEIRDTMSITGFLHFFAAYETIDAGLGALN